MAAPFVESPPGRARVSNGQGVAVKAVCPGSPAGRAGLKPGDTIRSIDGVPVKDFLDFYVASFGSKHLVSIQRAGERADLEVDRGMGEDSGLEVRLGRLKRCTNKCVFCFVDQLPRGLRSALYFKDEDYRLSFLHGSYLTLTNLKPHDEKRIVEMHLSPTYVSVHATDEAVRARLLGRRQPESILAVLDRLGERGIRFHTQVVVVPGYNDGETLTRTLADLCNRAEVVLSTSVVPVGLTSHRRGLTRIRRVDRDLALSLVREVSTMNRRMRRLHGRGIVYAADELVILSGLPIPRDTYYDDYPQIENGVGLLRRLLDSGSNLRVPSSLRARTAVFVTGVLARPYIERVAMALTRQGLNVRVVAVRNDLFGRQVTVTGLLSGCAITQAVVKALRGQRSDAVVLPPNTLNDGLVALDDVHAADIERAAGVPVVVGDYDLGETVARLARRLGT